MDLKTSQFRVEADTQGTSAMTAGCAKKDSRYEHLHSGRDVAVSVG